MQTQASEPKTIETAPDADCSICLTTESLHNFTGPVNQMCSLADVLVKRYGAKLDNEAETLFGFFKGSADRLQILLAGLRTYIQVTTSCSNPDQRCDEEALLAAAMAPLEHEIKETGAQVTHDPLPELICDPAQISWVFTGLIENSIKFRGECAPEIHVSSRSRGGVWLLSIRDNGIGIPEKQKKTHIRDVPSTQQRDDSRSGSRADNRATHRGTAWGKHLGRIGGRARRHFLVDIAEEPQL